MTKSKGIQSIKVSGRILRALTETERGMPLSQLARQTGMPPGQCHSYVTSLKKSRLVSQDVDTGAYTLGPFALELGVAWLKHDSLAKETVNLAKRLANDTGFMSLVSIWTHKGPTIVHVSEAVQPMALNIRQGTTFSSINSATGAVFAAFGSEVIKQSVTRELKDHLQFRQSDRLHHEKGFWDYVEAVKNDRRAATEGRPIPAVNAISSPNMGKQDTLSFACTLVGSITELKVGPREKHRLLMAQVNKEIDSWGAVA